MWPNQRNASIQFISDVSRIFKKYQSKLLMCCDQFQNPSGNVKLSVMSTKWDFLNLLSPEEN